MYSTHSLKISIIDRLSETLDEGSVQRAAAQDPQFAAYISRLQRSLSEQSLSLRDA